jgi:hypothetical protein
MALILRPSAVLIVWVNRIPGLCLCSAGNPTRGGALSHRAIVNLDVLDNFEPGPALSAIDTDKGGKRQTEQEDVGGRRPFSPRGYWADGVTSTSGQTGSGGTAIRSGTAAWAVTATTITPSAASIAAIRFIAGLLGLGVLAT